LKTFTSSVALLAAGVIALHADPPAGYYTTAEGKAGHELREALHTIIRNHHSLPYSSSGFDTSDALKILDQNPAETNSVSLVYNGFSALISSFGITAGWNREHQWPNSYGIDDVAPAYSDLFNLRACDATVNSSRGNKYFDFSDTNSASYRFPAHLEAPLCSTDSDSWEPRPSERGDIARAMFYLATRYTGDVPNEPELVLTDDVALINATNSYMGRLSTLLAWHAADPVDAAEQLRNDRIYALYQTNRNPFVDHPEWVNLTFAPAHTNPPVLTIAAQSNSVTLSWLATNQTSHLEFTTNLSGLWFTVTIPPTLTNGHFSIARPNTIPHAFFRLSIK
jgi:endonuclease I